MDILKKRVSRDRVNAKYRDIPIYTTQEATDKGLKFIHWREATPDYLYVETDDGYVVPVIHMKKYGPRWYLKTEIWPAFIAKKGGSLNWQERKNAGDYWNLTPWKTSWIEKEINSTRFKKAVAEYAKQIFNDEIDISAIGKLIRPDVKNSAWVWRRYLKNKKVQEIVTEEIEKLYAEQGITKRTIIALEQEALQLARDGEDGYLLLKVAGAMAKRLGMDVENKLLTTDSVELIQTTRDIVKQIEDQKKMKLERVTSHPKSEIIENAAEEVE